MRCRPFTWSVLLVAVACSSPLSPREQGDRDLAQHQAKWHAAGVHAYAFDYDVIAMAQRPGVRIEVRGDTVARVVDRATGAELPTAGWPTIDSVFAEARAALARTEYHARVMYDGTRGYPTRVEVVSDVPDTGFTLVVGGWAPSI